MLTSGFDAAVAPLLTDSSRVAVGERLRGCLVLCFALCFALCFIQLTGPERDSIVSTGNASAASAGCVGGGGGEGVSAAGLVGMMRSDTGPALRGRGCGARVCGASARGVSSSKKRASSTSPHAAL